ncbi:hypothetical protein AQ621_16880 (plasmid) [Marinobacter sp. P4B1]|nr:hypothetical protein AQ621_16880 [Marinobacter sp. P4B1]
MKAGGFQAAIDEEATRPIAQNQELELGKVIAVTQKRLAKTLISDPGLWREEYSRLGDEAPLRVKRFLIDCSSLSKSAVDHLDRTMLSLSHNSPGSEYALTWMIESHRLCPEFLTRIYYQVGTASASAKSAFMQWRHAINSLTEQFYHAAIKIYWSAVRSGDQDPDEVTSDAMSLLIRCAERYNPERGSFAAYFMTFAKYAQMKRLHSKLDEAAMRTDMPDEHQEALVLMSSPDNHAANRPELDVSQKQMTAIVQRLIGELSEEERLIVAHHFDMGRQNETQASLAKRMNLTKGRISQIKSAALKKLKRRLEECGY